MRKDLYKDLYDLETKHWWHISKRKIVQRLIKTFNKIKDPKILDVGCGTGKNMEELRKFGEVWGIDQSNEAIKYCKKRGLENVKIGDAQKTNLKSNYFNIVTLLDVLEHTDDDKTLYEMRRIIKKDGFLIITVPAFSWLWSRWDEMLYHKRRYTIDNLKNILLKNDFQIIKAAYLYSFLVLPALLIRTVKSLFLKNNYPSDFKLSNPLINLLLKKLAELEFILSNKFPIRFGTSILLVAKK